MNEHIDNLQQLHNALEIAGPDPSATQFAVLQLIKELIEVEKHRVMIAVEVGE